MTITTHTGRTPYPASLPAGPVTEMRWYRTHTCTGLLVVFRRTADAAPVVTFTMQVRGQLRRLRVVAVSRA